jgi:probable rRNA maturation factor
VKTTFGNPQREVEIDTASVRRLVSSLARGEGIRGGEVSIVFVDDAYIRDLKGRYLGARVATDVLAFPLGDVHPTGGRGGRRRSRGPRAVEDDLLGEVYVSTERAIDQARQGHIALSQEVARLIVHGLLHLFGYRDDEVSSRVKMIRRQESFLRENRRLAMAVARRTARPGRRGGA